MKQIKTGLNIIEVKTSKFNRLHNQLKLIDTHNTNSSFNVENFK